MSLTSTPTSWPVLQVANAHAVTASLLVGGDLDSYDEQLAEVQLLELVVAGVTHIVDARIECHDQALVAAVAPEISSLWHGMDDAGQAVPASWWDRGVAWASAAIEEGGRVLTHCHMGINRGPSLGFAVLLAGGWDPVGAIDAIRRARPVAAVGYAEQALAWHHRRTGASPETRRTQAAALAAWRAANPHETRRIIAGIRARQADRRTGR